MTAPPPIDVRHLFPAERASLLDLLTNLRDHEWHRLTVCDGWTVHDLALHLLAVDVQNLSGGRDGFGGPPDAPSPGDLVDWETLVAWLNARNADWLAATRRISPRLVRELMTLTGRLFDDYLTTIDMDAPTIPVSWAGPDPAPTWLHIAREYTERWIHHQQIRDATGRPGFSEPAVFAPVLDAFARALPHALRETSAPTGAVVRLVIAGPAGGVWTVIRNDRGWRLDDNHARPALATVTIDPDRAWRLFTKGISHAVARADLTIDGDQRLAEPLTRMVTIMA